MKQLFFSSPGRMLSLVLFLILIGPATHAQAPAWQMAVGITGSVANVKATATDASGNVYLAGEIDGTVHLGSITLTNTGVLDAFVAKWNRATASFEWALASSSSAGASVNGIAVSGASIYIAGTCGGITSFGPNISISGVSFLAKLTDTGANTTFIWAQQFSGSPAIKAVAVSGANVYIAGYFTGANIQLGSVTLTNASSNRSDGFVAKFLDTGNAASFGWAKRAGGSDDDNVNALAVNGNNVYVAGEFASPTADFGGITLTNTNITQTMGYGRLDIFVAKLTDAGSSSSFTWSQKAGGSDHDFLNAMAVSGSNIYLTGYFTSPTIDFGSNTLTNVGIRNMFVTKLTDVGTNSSFTWSKQAGGDAWESGEAIAVDGASVYVAGNFNSRTSTFGTTTLTNADVTSTWAIVTSDVFVTKLTDTGTDAPFVWTQQGGGGSNDRAHALAVYGANVYVAGYAIPPAVYGSNTLTNPTAGPMLNFMGFLLALPNGAVTATSLALRPESIALFPNPANTTTTVQLPLIPGAPTATLTLLDALGRTIRTQTAPTDSKTELDLTGLAPGLYAVRVAAGGSTATRQLVVE